MHFNITYPEKQHFFSPFENIISFQIVVYFPLVRKRENEKKAQFNTQNGTLRPCSGERTGKNAGQMADRDTGL
jgi:hypothetical protein